MAKLTEISNSLGGKLSRLLSDKPIWVSVIVYTAFTGLCFGLVYLLMHLLIVRWWVVATVVIAIGITWGTVAHRAKTNEKADE